MITTQHKGIELEKFVLVKWGNSNLAFRLSDIKEVISGNGTGKNLHPLYEGSQARASDFKLLTNSGCLIPSNTKPVQIEGKELKLDTQSSSVLGDQFDFVTFNDGNIAISIRNI